MLIFIHHSSFSRLKARPGPKGALAYGKCSSKRWLISSSARIFQMKRLARKKGRNVLHASCETASAADTAATDATATHLPEQSADKTWHPIRPHFPKATYTFSFGLVFAACHTHRDDAALPIGVGTEESVSTRPPSASSALLFRFHLAPFRNFPRLGQNSDGQTQFPASGPCY